MTEHLSLPPSSGIGQVITRFGADLLVETPDGLLRCTARRKLDHLACGDQVQWERQAQGNAAVTRILPRHNVLERPDFRGKPRAIAANIDLLVVVTAWQPAPLWDMLDRYLIAARRLSADVLLVMNKADLRASHATAEDEACLEEFQRIGLPILHVSAAQNEGVGEILRAINERTAIVVGQSGVGKSSIAVQLLPEEDIRVGAVADTGEGRHTTTSATLYRLPSGGTLIDSPGVRDFGLTGLDFAALERGFPEFAPFLGECRFNNCTHQHEPGCAIKAAVSAGEIPARRFSRYLVLLAGL
ncbi:MAG: ribosome small subunit-dependent GTPase A [Candidatus Thiothrix moscowensis]|nr:ribosome small subunit-dependent GTPase A [Candidatus Thiothrix moscowensis]